MILFSKASPSSKMLSPFPFNLWNKTINPFQKFRAFVCFFAFVLMAAKEEFEVDHVTTPITPGTSFSQLLFGDDDDVVHDEKAFAFGTVDQTFNNNNNNNLSTNSSLFSIHNTPKMLCFGNNYQNEGDLMNNVTPQKSSIITSSDNNSSSASNSCNTSFNYSLPMSNVCI